MKAKMSMHIAKTRPDLPSNQFLVLLTLSAPLWSLSAQSICEENEKVHLSISVLL